MKKMRLTQTLFGLCVAFLFTCSTASADWSDTFANDAPDLGLGGAGWFFVDETTNAPDFTSIYFEEGVMRFFGTASGTVFDLNVAGGIPESFNNVRVKADVSMNRGLSSTGFQLANNVAYVVGRSDEFGQSYGLSLDFNDGDFGIFYAAGINAVSLNGVNNPSWFNRADRYTLELSIFGDQLTGRVFAENGTLLQTVTATDGTIAAGISGVGVTPVQDTSPSYSTLIAAEFDNVSAISLGSADFDQDGDVDGSDFLAWQAGFGVGTELSQGDVDGDADVDANDLAAWQSQYGTGNGQGSLSASGNAVPEPSTLCMLGASILGWMVFRIRR